MKSAKLSLRFRSAKAARAIGDSRISESSFKLSFSHFLSLTYHKLVDGRYMPVITTCLAWVLVSAFCSILAILTCPCHLRTFNGNIEVETQVILYSMLLPAVGMNSALPRSRATSVSLLTGASMLRFFDCSDFGHQSWFGGPAFESFV